jgi:polyphenol oxidase
MVSRGRIPTGLSVFSQDGRGVLQCAPLTDFAWLDHGFSTRHSSGWLEQVALASLKQIHSSGVLSAHAPGVQGEGDALVTNVGGLHIAVRTADCLPILLVDPVHRAIASIHSGWRGTVSGVAANAVSRMAAEFGTVAADLHAAIGPGIGACCFEVGPEVAAQFGQSGRVHIDLAGALREQLALAGVGEARIYTSGDCTYCQADQFWSFRRQGEAAGRMWSGAAVMAGG